MIEGLVGQLMQSGAGAEMLKQLQEKGLSAQQATAAVSATAQGAMENMPGGSSAGGLASMAAGLMGGGQPGGLGGMLAGLSGGANASGNLGALVTPVAQFVAQKTGLAPEMATMVVSLVLPKLMEMVGAAPTAGAAPAAQAPSLGGMLGGLLK